MENKQSKNLSRKSLAVLFLVLFGPPIACVIIFAGWIFHKIDSCDEDQKSIKRCLPSQKEMIDFYQNHQTEFDELIVKAKAEKIYTSIVADPWERDYCDSSSSTEGKFSRIKASESENCAQFTRLMRTLSIEQVDIMGHEIHMIVGISGLAVSGSIAAYEYAFNPTEYALHGQFSQRSYTQITDNLWVVTGVY